MMYSHDSGALSEWRIAKSKNFTAKGFSGSPQSLKNCIDHLTNKVDNGGRVFMYCANSQSAKLIKPSKYCTA
jgi:hypothetical protein